MQNNNHDTLPKYKVPEDLTLDFLEGYIISILHRFEAGNIGQEDLLNHADSLEEFLWKKYGDSKTRVFPMWETNIKFRMCNYVIDWMNVSNEFGYLITKKDVSVLIDFLNKPSIYNIEEKDKLELQKYFKKRVDSQKK